MNLAAITPLILTYNEAPNIRRCLERLTWATRVVVVDSGSSDETLGICGEFPNVVVVHRPFDNHTAQWNFALDRSGTEWVLTLDADYVLNAEFVRELEAVNLDGEARAWFANFRFLMHGKRLRGSLYPPRALLFDRRQCCYIPDGHTQTLQIEVPANTLQARIDHDDRKPLARWLESQRRYAVLESEKLAAESHPVGWPDRLRTMIWPAAPAAFLYTLFVKGVILDGWAGWFYVLQRTYAELLLSLHLLDCRLRGAKRGREEQSAKR